MEALEMPAKTLSGDKSLDRDDAKPLKEGSKGEKSLENGGTEASCLDEDGEGLEDFEINGVSSLLQMKESGRNIDINGGTQMVEGFGTLLGAVRKSKEIGVGKVFPRDDDGVSLVDIHVEASEIDGKERRDLDDMEHGGGDWRCEFSAGDFVWGKIRSHPWWPGQVCNPSDASDNAVEVRQKGRLLVAYFGDGSFAWCHPFQLKPFVENFEDLSKLSNSKNFLNAVQTSVDEIGRLVELKMTCSCVPKQNCAGLDTPLAANAGIKEGVLVPEGGIRKLSIGFFDPEEILGKLKQIAQDVSVSNLLEFSVLKGWLSAFNRSIGRYEMPLYYEPLSIPGLEENARTLMVNTSDYREAVEVPITGPVEEDWISSGGPKAGHHTQSLLRCPEISEEGMYQSRKQKSIAEIIKGELDVRARKDEAEAQKGTNSAEQASSSRRKKSKGNDKANDDNGTNSSSKRRKRKGAELSGSVTAGKGKMSSVEADVVEVKEEMGKDYPSRQRKKKNKGASNNNNDSGRKEDTNNHTVNAKTKMNSGSGIANSDAESKDIIVSGFSSRERKKSKYLSPPYTSSIGKLRNTGIGAESLKVYYNTRIGEPMSKATGNFVRSPRVLHRRDERNRLPEEVHAEQDASNEPSFHTPKQYLNRIVDLEKVKTSANEVLIEVRSVALSPQYRRKNKSFEIAVEFLSVFRSSVYQDGSNYKIYNQFQSHRKRKSPDSMSGSSGKDKNLIDHVPSGHRSNQKKVGMNEDLVDHVTSGHRSKQKKVGMNEETNIDQSNPRQAARASLKKTSEESKAYNSKIKQAGRAAVTKKNDKEVVENASSLSLFVTFGPGSSLPTKDDLIRTYSSYGALNTEDTDVFYNDFCARVVFLSSSDAEQAFKSSQNDSPFGTSNVSFRLLAHEHREMPSAKPPPVAKERAKRSKKSSASQILADQTSQLNYIRQKLELLTSILEMSDEKMSSDIKSKLQTEIKGLLEKVNTMVESSS